jgi:hypothetical protein
MRLKRFVTAKKAQKIGIEWSKILSEFPRMFLNQAMSCLHSLSISDCNKLNSVPDGITFVVGLRELGIKWMPKSFKDIVFVN